MKITIHTATISHRHGVNTYYALTREALTTDIHGYVKSEWNEILEGVEQPEDAAAAIEMYFEKSDSTTSEHLEFPEVVTFEVEDKEKFPQGFENWQETHFQMVNHILETCDKEDTMASAIQKEFGTGGLWELAKDLTDSFEQMYRNETWEDGEWMETIDEFTDIAESMFHHEGVTFRDFQSKLRAEGKPKANRIPVEVESVENLFNIDDVESDIDVIRVDKLTPAQKKYLGIVS